MLRPQREQLERERDRYEAGTSMSTPLTAGLAGALYQDLVVNRGVASPKPSLVKALMINGAVDVTPGGGCDYTYDTSQSSIPLGWGRVNARNAMYGPGGSPSQRNIDFENEVTGNAVATGETYTRQVTANAGAPFRVTLVWTDYPAAPNSLSPLVVNDLDLEVVEISTGSIYRGNVFSGNWSTTGGSADRYNVVENVYIQSPVAGVYTIRVKGFQVSQDQEPDKSGANQDFSLVSSGSFGVVNNPPAASIENPPEGANVAGLVFIRINATDTEDATGTLTVQWNLDGGPWLPAAWNGVRYEAFWNSLEATEGNHVINARATDSGGSTGADSNNVFVDNINTPPTAAYTYSCSGPTCNFDGSGSSDPDSAITSYAWNFGDGSAASGVTTSHTFAADGAYTVTLTVTDDQGATDGEAKSITVTLPSANPVMHVGDLDRSSAPQGVNQWRATVTIAVHDGGEALLASATVTGIWSTGGLGYCTTSASGTCSINSWNLSNFTSSTRFTVFNMSRSGYAYQSSANHDPDGDSSPPGASITVTKP